MRRYRPLPLVLALSALLLLVPPAPVQAKYIIEFADGQKMTVSNYQDTGKMVKVYTSLGSFAFRKDDIVRITDVTPEKQEGTEPPIKQAQRKPTPKFEEPSTLASAQTETKKPSGFNNSPEMQDFVVQVEDALFRMRYVFALIVGLKVFKIFFAASAR